MDEKIAEKRLVSFNKECILAGPRPSVIGFLKMLMNLGADVTKATSAKSLITSKSNIVLLLKNEGKSKKFPQITVLSRSWWDYYHNPKKHRYGTELCRGRLQPLLRAGAVERRGIQPADRL